MKKHFFYILLIILLTSATAFIIGCGSNASGGGSDGGGGGGTSTVKLTGSISGPGYITTSQGFHTMLVTSSIETVIVFNCKGGFWTSNVVNGKFTVEAEAGRPVGMIFAGTQSGRPANHYFLGYLTMGSSIDSVPLNLADSASKEINLNNLLINSGVVTPETNLVASSGLSADEKSAMTFGNQLFSCIVKNPDVDGNEEVDILETPSKYYRPYFLYFVSGGSLTSSSGDGTKTPTSNPYTYINQYRFNLDVYNSNPSGGLPNNITIKAPTTTSRTGSFDASNSTNTSTRHLYYDSQVRDGTPESGTYTVSGLSSTVSFEISNTAISTQYIAIAKPTLTVSGGILTNISWTYVAGGSGGTLSDPKSIVDVAAIQIDPVSGSRLYDTQLILAPSVTSHTLTNAYSSSGNPISWSDVKHVSMAYNDVFGNQVVVKWTR